MQSTAVSTKKNTSLGTVEPSPVPLNAVTGRISHMLVLCVRHVSLPVLLNSSFTYNGCSIVSRSAVSHMKFLGLNEMFEIKQWLRGS